MSKHKKDKKKQPGSEGFCCRGRIWIDRDGQTFLGYGRVILLERINEYGSISRAARTMEMSYKHAWDLVDSMNRQAVSPLVISRRGGQGGGGAELTREGEEAISRFWNFYEKFQKFLDQESQKLPF
ncbi:MAG: winged helix-turn-helix domain-containing protein [Desulfurivibrionaceae bacterium]